MRETRKSHPGSNSAGRGTHGGKQGVTTVHHADVQSREGSQKPKQGQGMDPSNAKAGEEPVKAGEGTAAWEHGSCSGGDPTVGGAMGEECQKTGAGGDCATRERASRK